MRNIIYLFLSVAALVGCCKDDEPDTTSRTVLVYMAGDNNLTAYNEYHYLNNDLQEIIEGSKLLEADQRLLVFIDSLGSSAKTAKASIVEVHDGNCTTLREFDKEIYTSDPAQFRDIIKWVTDNAQADSYGLVLWGHAVGWTVDPDSIAQTKADGARRRAYGVDEGEGQTEGRKWMNITQMARALEGLPKMEFIFADCCCMMCAEVGYELRNATNYLIGSPAEIPGNGAPYDKVIPNFYKNDSALYRGIIDTYYNYYIEDFMTDPDLNGYSVPLSVIDTKYIELLAKETHDVLGNIPDGYPQYPAEPNLNGVAFYLYYEAPVMYDMRAFIKSYAPEDLFQKWDQTYHMAVPYYRMSMQWMTIYRMLEQSFWGFNKDESLYGCVSMFIPRNLFNYYSGTYSYNTTYNNYEWNRVIDWSRFGWN